MASWEHSALFAPHDRPGRGGRSEVDIRLPGNTDANCDEFFLEFRMPTCMIFVTARRLAKCMSMTRLRLGIRRNRARMLVRLDDVVAVTRFADIAES